MAVGIIFVLSLTIVGAFSDNVVNIGVLLPMYTDFPFSLQRTLPAIELAVENLQRLNIVPDYTFRIHYQSSNCSETAGPLAAIDMHTKKTADVFLGPVCDYAIAPIARFSNSWNIPVITSGALVSAFQDKSQYGLLTRVLGSYTKVAKFFTEMMAHFNWTHIGLVYTDHGTGTKGKSDCFFVMEAIYLELKRNQTYSLWHSRIDLDSPGVDMGGVLNDIRQHARVVAMCASPDHVRELVIQGQEQYDDIDDFAFINIDIFNRASTSNPWYRDSDTPDRNNKAKKGFESVLTVTLRTPASAQYGQFSNQVKSRTASRFPDVNLNEQSISSHIGALHDGVILYALALKEHLDTGGNVSDGSHITAKMWNRTFQGITGTVAIDENGDRDMDFSLKDMNPNSVQFEVVGNYYGSTKMYEPVVGKQIHWPGEMTSPPKDTPDCGFDGDLCPSEVAEPFPRYAIVLIVLGCLLIVSSVLIFFIYKWKFSNYNYMLPP